MIIIGAGIAGLGCATKLVESGIPADRIVILEARDRSGGRIHNAADDPMLDIPLSGISPAALEMGAGWIHGHGKQHLLSQLLSESKAGEPVVTDWRRTQFSYQGSGRQLGLLAIGSAMMRVGFSAAIGYARRALTSKHQSKAAASTLFPVASLHRTPEAQMLLYTQAEASYAAPLSDMAVSLLGQNETQGIDAQPHEGMSWFVKKLVNCAPSIRYRARVVSLSHASPDESVQAHVCCADGSALSARLGVVVTVPLGVLKNDMIKFSPPLPPAHLAALKRVAMAKFTKVLVIFPRRFWDSGKHGFIVVRDDSAARNELHSASYLCVWHNVSAIHGAAPDKPNALLGIATSHGALHVDSLTENELEQLVSQRLCAAFGLETLPFKPLAILRSAWNNDPLSGYGAYTYPTLGAQKADFDALATDCPPFYFAGEHTWLKEIGTVHGALQSGQAAALRIIEKVLT
ncbi:flavin monoamine oxidase family protein [Pseudohongiella spirulinae]|uniref:flavin monoamine oxidase family protein n=1 Tax=Pseudohongiella spirulinae TaxID=1249552 RepID=UPI001F3A6BB2|nr:NAD(P)/FAD-dependent oxidoreductase [Pseudohongiella spirulinae]